MFEWNEREILRYLGLRGHAAPENVADLVRECEEELERAAAPRSIWREYPFSAEGEVLNLSVMRVKNSRALAKNLAGCSRVILFAATLGSGVDVLLQRYSRLQMSKCVVLQAAAASMLETYCDGQNEALRRRYLEQGAYLRPRFSPGYGDFPLEYQRPLAAALELNKRIGITLTDSLLMAPSKSVTAVIGVSPVPAACMRTGCLSCARTDCAYRDAG